MVSEIAIVFVVSQLNDSGRAIFSLEYLGQDMRLSPEDLVVMLLEKLKHCAENGLGKEGMIRNTVITIPGSFTNSQRESLGLCFRCWIEGHKAGCT